MFEVFKKDIPGELAEYVYVVDVLNNGQIFYYGPMGEVVCTEATNAANKNMPIPFLKISSTMSEKCTKLLAEAICPNTSDAFLRGELKATKEHLKDLQNLLRGMIPNESPTQHG